MSDTILAGDFTVYYEAETRRKAIKWSGLATGTRTVNELYSALQDLFDDLTQMDDGSPMSAQTPTEYTIGIIDASDDDPWFIDRDSVEHLTGGAVKTASWLRAEGTNTGIVRMNYTQTVALVAGDIGKTIVMTIDGDTGTVLDYNDQVTPKVLWIRPATSAIGNSFNDAPTPNGAFTITGGTGTGTQLSGAAVSGESLWANIFTLGTIEPHTHVYVQQGDGTLLVAYKGTSDWWSDGQIDILINVKEVGVETSDAVVQALVRQYTKSYDWFETDLTAGGRNPIPFSTGVDLDNDKNLMTGNNTGYREMVLTTVAGGTFTKNNTIKDDSDATIEGRISARSGTGASQTVQYYLIGDPLNDFTAGTGAFTEYNDTTGASTGVTATAVAPTNVGPANLTTPPTITFGANDAIDITENGVTEPYSVVIDCNQHALTVVWQWLKWVTRQWDSAIDLDAGAQTIPGRFYRGSEQQALYSGQVGGEWTQGNTVYLFTAGSVKVASAVITADHATGATGKLMLREYHVFTTGAITKMGDNAVYASSTVTAAIDSMNSVAIVKKSPLGDFAGGKFFGARGVAVQDYLTTDNSNFQLIDDNGTVVVAPSKISVTVGNTRNGDKVAVFRLTGAGGQINKTEMTNTVQSAGAITVVVSAGIAADVPGKTLGGALRIVDDSPSVEYRLRFASWAASTFTLASTAGLVADAGTTSTQITDAAGGFTANARVGDLIRNVTAAGYGYVVSVDSDTQLTTTTIAGQTTGNTYDINTLPVAVTGADRTYVGLVDSYETTGTDASPGTEAGTITYLADIFTIVRARRNKMTKAGVAVNSILPYEATATVANADFTNSVIRTADSITT